MARLPQAARGKKRRKVNLWPRRIVTGSLLLAVVALAAWGLWALVSLFLAAGTDTPASAAQSAATTEDRVTADGIFDPEAKTVTVPPCSRDTLEISVNVSATSVGAGLDVPFTLTNTGRSACVTTLGQYGLLIATGEDTYFDSRQCEGWDPDDTPLLLQVGAQWSHSLRWDGRRYDGCAPVDGDGDGAQDVGGAGGYRLVIYEDAEPAIQAIGFEVH